MASWLTVGAVVQRELDDVSGIFATCSVTALNTDLETAEVLYEDNSKEEDVPFDELRPFCSAVDQDADAEASESEPPFRDKASMDVPSECRQEDPVSISLQSEASVETASVIERIRKLRAETAGLTSSVDGLKNSQEHGLTKLSKAMHGVSEAQHALNERLGGLDQCNADLHDMVDAFREEVGHLATMVGFQDKAFMERVKSSMFSSSMSGQDLDMVQILSLAAVENHNVIPAWLPGTGMGRAMCAISTTLCLSDYSWPDIIPNVVYWVNHHLSLGFAPVFIFVDDPDTSKVEALQEALGQSAAPGACVELINKEDMRNAWTEDQTLLQGLGGMIEHSSDAAGMLNNAAALRRCHRRGDVDWLLCNLCIHEAVWLAGSDVPSFFGATPSKAWQITLLNNEAIPMDGHGPIWFEQAKLCKVSPLAKLPFLSNHFPAGDEEPYVLEHPDGFGSSTVEFWKSHYKCLKEQYGFSRVTAGRGNCNYFDAYSRGKVAIQVSTAADRNAAPKTHRWQLPDPADLQTLVCNPSSAFIVNYNNCCGLKHFQRRHAFHAIDDEQLKKCYEDIHIQHKAISQHEAMSLQVQEGFVATCTISDCSGMEPFRGFLGWASVDIGNNVLMHMPLTLNSINSSESDSTSYAGDPPRCLQAKSYEQAGQQLSVGECLQGGITDLEGSTSIIKISTQVAKRGYLILEVVLTAFNPSLEAGLFVCAAKLEAACDLTPGGSQWTTRPPVSGVVGWRCLFKTQLSTSGKLDALVKIGLGTASSVPADTLAFPCASFEPLACDFPAMQSPGNGMAATFQARLTFSAEAESLPPELQAAHAAFYKAFDGHNGYEGETVNNGGNRELTYGEVEFLPFFTLLRDVVQPRPGETFLDLGSGTGRALLVAALGFPELHACVGYEVLQVLHETAELAVRRAKDDLTSSSSSHSNLAPIDLRFKSFLGEPWEQEQVDILWVASLCFGRETMTEILEHAVNLKPGSRVVTMHPLFGASLDIFEPVLVNGDPKITVEMSFGEACVYVMRRV